MAPQNNLLERVLEQLDFCVIVATIDLHQILYSNRTARDLLGETMPPVVKEAASNFILARRSLQRMPAAMRVEIADRAFYVRVQELLGTPPAELLILREEVVRDAELYRVLNARYRITRREYQILAGLRLGKTNPQLAKDLGLARGTIARHLHRLLQRFEVPNRTRLVNVIEELVPRRG